MVNKLYKNARVINSPINSFAASYNSLFNSVSNSENTKKKKIIKSYVTKITKNVKDKRATTKNIRCMKSRNYFNILQ